MPPVTESLLRFSQKTFFPLTCILLTNAFLKRKSNLSTFAAPQTGIMPVEDGRALWLKLLEFPATPNTAPKPVRALL